MVCLGLDQVYLDLNRRVGQTAQDLGFRYDLERHQIKQRNVQRADILCCCAMFGHNEDIFAFQHSARGQAVGYFNRQADTSFDN